MKATKLLRQAAVNALVGKTRAGAKVFSNRPNPLQQAPSALPGGAKELPAIIVYTRSTRSEVFDESPRRYKHETELTVEAALEVTAGTEIDDDLDEFEQEVLDALLVDDTLGGTVDDLQLTGSTNTIGGDGAKLLAAVIITFEARHFTYAPAEDTQSLDDLDHVHTEYSLGGAQDDPRDRAQTDIEGLNQ